MSKKFSVIQVLAAGCMWGCMGLLVRSLSTVGLGSIEIGFLRAAVAFVVMLFGMLLFNRKALHIRLKDIWCFIGTGALSLAFFNYCYFITIQLTSLAVAAILLYTAPTFVMLMSAVLFKEKITMQKLLAVLLAFAGCAFVSGLIGQSQTLSGVGILLGLGSGFGYALYSIFGRYALERGYSSMTISLYTFLFAALATFFLSDRGAIIAAFTASPVLLPKVILLIILVTVAPYICYTRGLAGLENGTASVIASIEPVVATLVGIIIYKEGLDVWSVIGILLVLGSILLINWDKKERKK